MDYTLVLTSNKHAYARRRGDLLEIRIPRHLSAVDRDRVITSLLQKQSQRGQGAGLFARIREEGRVRFAWGDTLEVPEAVLAYEERAFRRWILAQVRAVAHTQVALDVRAFFVQTAPTRTLRHVLIRDLTSRWGSCSTEGDITISLATVLLPYTLYAYVCAHEVAHLRHMNHSPRFWQHLATLMPDWQARRTALRAYHLSS